MTEREEHFLTMLGQCLEGARLAEIEVEIELPDGRLVRGVPRSSPLQPEHEMDHTGVDFRVELDEDLVELEHVRSYRIIRRA